MKYSNFKRLRNRVSLYKRCLTALTIFERDSFIICLTKNEQKILDNEYCMEFDNQLYAKGLFYSGKSIKKKIIMVDSNHYNPECMELIKSKHLKQKTKKMFEKWIKKIKKQLVQNYDKIAKSDPLTRKTFMKFQSEKEHQYVKKVKKEVKENKHSEWKSYYEVMSDKFDEVTTSNDEQNKKIKKDHKPKRIGRKEVDEMIAKIYSKDLAI